MTTNPVTLSEPRPVEALLEWWYGIPEDDKPVEFLRLPRQDAATLFLALGEDDRAFIIRPQADQERRVWLRLLEPDDAADLIQAFPEDEQAHLLELVDYRTRAQVEALLAYQHDVAGGKMSPQYIRVPQHLTAEQAIGYLRLQASAQEQMVYYAYVLDDEDHLLGVVSYRDLLLASPAVRVADIMARDVIRVPEDMDQEEVARLLRGRSLFALPVVDAGGRMRGIITVDDLAEVEREEATEDIQKIGGVEALDTPYFRTPRTAMLRKRGGWLAVLFVGQMLTVTAMGFFEDEIQAAVVLALFVPLIISSGGNSGSQASTLVVRAMALGEVRLADWLLVIRREIGYGFALGVMLALLGAIRIFVWESLFGTYGAQFFRLGLTVSISVVAVVMWGTIVGSMLPLILRRLRFDPASASAPLVATLVDVTGLVIYLSVARIALLGGW